MGFEVTGPNCTSFINTFSVPLSRFKVTSEVFPASLYSLENFIKSTEIATEGMPLPNITAGIFCSYFRFLDFFPRLVLVCAISSIKILFPAFHVNQAVRQMKHFLTLENF